MTGRKVRAVWMQFEDENGKLSKQRLILSTLSDLTAKEIFEYYARRWSIEDLFNQMKNKWGWREAWQQSRQVLHRWTQILSIGYALPQLLATYCADQIQNLIQLTPWRKQNQITSGRIRLGLQNILCNVRIRDWWSPKCHKFQPPIRSQAPQDEQVGAEYQLYTLSKNNSAEYSPPGSGRERGAWPASDSNRSVSPACSAPMRLENGFSGGVIRSPLRN